MVYEDIASTVELREGTSIDAGLSSESWYVTVWKRFAKNRFALICWYYSVFILMLAITYPLFLPMPPLTTQPFYSTNTGGGSNAYTNLRHPLGTDSIGRDVVSYILAGTQTSMIVGIGSTLIFLMIGVPFGLISGFFAGSKIEEIIMRITDFFLALPFLIIAILGIKVLNSRFAGQFDDAIIVWIIMFVLGVFGWAGTTRLVNATTKQVIELEYISAVKCLGASNTRIILKHILPNVLAPIIVIATLGVGGGILSEAGITFLGFGSNSIVSWGAAINNARRDLTLHPQLALAPGFAVFFIVLAINLLGDTLRDALDPKLKE